ncbi:MAG: Wzz/FepE/Etk N-terminal domain-containing protein [Pirellulales bacterium]
MNNISAWSLTEAFRALYRYKWRAGFAFALCVAGGAAYLIFAPKRYESEAKLFVRVGRENATVDPTVVKGDVIALNSSREIEMNSIVEHVKSRSILEKTLGILRPATPHEGEEERERAFTKLKSRVTVTSPRQSTIVTITSKGDTPEEAREIVATMTAVYLDEHMRISRPDGSHEFLTNQSRRVNEEYAKAQGELRDAKNQGGMASIEGRRTALEAQINSIETQTHDVIAELAAVTARLEKRKNTIATLPKPLLKQMVGGMPNDGLASMRDRLFQLQVQQEELRSKYNDGHPLIAALNNQVQELTDVLNREDPEREQIIITLCSDDEARKAALTAQNESLRSQLTGLQRKLSTLNDDEMRVAQSSLKVRQLETELLTYASNAEDARLDDALRDGKISNVSELQPASFAPLPVSPQKSLVMLLAGIAGLGSGAGVALISEQVRRNNLENALEDDDLEANAKYPLFDAPTRQRAGLHPAGV